MSKKAYIAIDLGAESGRTIVGVLDDDRLTLEEVHRFLHLPVRLPSGLHWDLTVMGAGTTAGNRVAGCRYVGRRLCAGWSFGRTIGVAVLLSRRA